MLTAKQSVMLRPKAINDAQYAARELEFVRDLLGYSEHLRECSREMPLSDAFLPVLVMLLEVLDLNAPLEARQCAGQLRQILEVMFPDPGPGLLSDVSGNGIG
jgi:hypothetical protein